MSSQSRKTILLATDQQQSVLNALDASQPHPIAYTPYGHRLRENGLLSLLGFNGELPDPLTGHYHLGKGYRQFNPVLMRFNSPDSWSPFGEGGLNAYVYCDGEPVRGRDPTGHNNVFKSAWKAFQNRFMGRIPKRQRPQSSVPKNATGQISPPPPEKAFDIDKFTPEEIALNFSPTNTSTAKVNNLQFPFFAQKVDTPEKLLAHLQKSKENISARLPLSSPESRRKREVMLGHMEEDIQKLTRDLSQKRKPNAPTIVASKIREPHKTISI